MKRNMDYVDKDLIWCVILGIAAFLLLSTQSTVLVLTADISVSIGFAIFKYILAGLLAICGVIYLIYAILFIVHEKKETAMSEMGMKFFTILGVMSLLLSCVGVICNMF